MPKIGSCMRKRCDHVYWQPRVRCLTIASTVYAVTFGAGSTCENHPESCLEVVEKARAVEDTA